MRRGSSVESFLMTEQNDRFELDGRGTEQPPTFHTNLPDLLANLDPNVFISFLFFFFSFNGIEPFNWTRKNVMYVIQSGVYSQGLSEGRLANVFRDRTGKKGWISCA